MAPRALEASQLRTFLSNLPDWTHDQGRLVRSISFKDFKEAIAFVNRIADLAEKAGHHPDIDIRYNKVSLALATHDAGGITQSDINLASEIDKKFKQ